MSVFGNHLLRHLEERQKRDPDYTAGRFARDLGLTPSMLSRFTTGEAPACNPSTLTRICSSISDDPGVQAATQVAYLQDQRVKPGGDLVKIEAVSHKGRKAAESTLDQLAAALDPKTAAAVKDILRACSTSRSMSRMVQDLASFARREE